MNIDELTLRLLILLLPGMLSSIIIDSFTFHKERKLLTRAIHFLLLSALVYVILQLVYGLVYCFSTESNLTVWKAFTNKEVEINYVEVIFALVVAIPVGLLFTYLITKKRLYNILNTYRISNKYGDENLFKYFLNSENIDWIWIRDIESQLVYYGSCLAFASEGERDEIVLGNVSIFHLDEDTGEYKESYTLDKIYLTIDPLKHQIEVPNF